MYAFFRSTFITHYSHTIHFLLTIHSERHSHAQNYLACRYAGPRLALVAACAAPGLKRLPPEASSPPLRGEGGDASPSSVSEPSTLDPNLAEDTFDYAD